MPTNEDFQGVSNCYVFKSRLQEYAQKVGLPTPVYETIKEGPSHEPSFRSAVIVNDVRYESLAGFFNRKAAEQSAAEVALVELARSDEVNRSITQPVHETGLCKNLLQEYAQKMNYAMPMYQCIKEETPSRAPVFTCTVEIGGILYIGGTAKTKKEAEIKAARTALLAIQSSASSSQNQLGHAQLTVLPCRKRAAEPVPVADETSNAPKPKKARFKKKSSKRKHSRGKMGKINAENVAIGSNINPVVESHANVNGESGSHEMKTGPFVSEVMKNSENEILVNDESGSLEMKSGPFASEATKNSENGISVNDEPGSLEMKSGQFASGATKNSENGISVNDESGSLEVKSRPFASEAMKNSENRISVNDESGSLEVKSRPFSSEAMKNSENGILVDLCEKETLAVEGSLVLNGHAAFDNGKSTELHFEENNIGTIGTEVSCADANRDKPEMSKEMSKQQQDNGVMNSEI